MKLTEEEKNYILGAVKYFMNHTKEPKSRWNKELIRKLTLSTSKSEVKHG